MPATVLSESSEMRGRRNHETWDVLRIRSTSSSDGNHNSGTLFLLTSTVGDSGRSGLRSMEGGSGMASATVMTTENQLGLRSKV